MLGWVNPVYVATEILLVKRILGTSARIRMLSDDKGLYRQIPILCSAIRVRELAHDTFLRQQRKHLCIARIGDLTQYGILLLAGGRAGDPRFCGTLGLVHGDSSRISSVNELYAATIHSGRKD